MSLQGSNVIFGRPPALVAGAVVLVEALALTGCVTAVPSVLVLVEAHEDTRTVSETSASVSRRVRRNSVVPLLSAVLTETVRIAGVGLHDAAAYRNEQGLHFLDLVNVR
ncbi:Uncharacterised protein [Mycolicibacterium phlei]|nr:Uncharacterised protein [Mycolicibacterium phlei]